MILTQDHQDTTQKEEALSRDRNLHQEAPNRERNLEKDGGRITDLHQEPGRPGSRIDLPPEEVGLDAEEEEQEPYFEAEDHVKDEAAALRVTEEQMEGDYLVDKATSSVSASNPWVLNEADVIVQDYLMEVWNITPVVNVLSTCVNGVIFSLNKGYFFDAKIFENLNRRNFLGQGASVIFSQGLGKLAGGNHITRKLVNSMK